jgi:hypothetical protein
MCVEGVSEVGGPDSNIGCSRLESLCDGSGGFGKDVFAVGRHMKGPYGR